MNKFARRDGETLNDWTTRIGSRNKKWIHRIKLEKYNRMLRFGFGFKSGRLFIRIDLWWVGFRINN